MSPHYPRPGTHASRILDKLKEYPHGVSDGQLARALATRHEIINTNCRLLESQGFVSREKTFGPIINKLMTQAPQAVSTSASLEIAEPAMNLSQEITPAEDHVDSTPSSPRVEPTILRPWFWEGNIQAVIAGHLERQGWTMYRLADTASREPGKDIVAKRGEAELWVTVKGFPEAHPSAQARVWFADAILDVVRCRQEDSAVFIAVGLPDFPLYHRWQQRTSWLQRAAPFDYLWVSEDGAIRFDSGRISIA